MKKNVISSEQIVSAVITGVVVAIVIYALKCGFNKVAKTTGAM